MYHASKWALEGFTQSLAQEVALLRHQRDPDRAGGLLHRLGRLVGQARHSQPPPYDDVRAAASRRRADSPRAPPGDPVALPPPFLRSSTLRSRRCACFFGRVTLALATADYASRLETCPRQWQPVALIAQGGAEER